ncbi:hypothetical protein [Leucobacter ruminantium]|uniref:Uncharacterized protein n=1 Tax=Leucobacter ruminantium TaxID=1289170 RepID=A0A939RZJ2_9MICO|nr:hypothetical protein [Leucobacter ruminantium]MBO1805896.1 hypothetical protein [Leucobacter ruminantium]
MAAHEPVITINDQAVDPGWSIAAGETILDGVTIVWGRDSLYEEVPPAVLKLEMIYRTGGTMLASYMQGMPVTVATDLGTLYRGRITSTRWKELYLWDEERQENVRYWLVTVTAHDPTAPIRAFIPTPAPLPVSAGSTDLDKRVLNAWNSCLRSRSQFPFFGSYKRNGTTYWGAAAMYHSVIDELIAAGRISGVWNLNVGSVPTYGYRVHTDRANAWQLLREVAGTTVLAEPCYRHENDTIYPATPTTASPGVRLVYSAGLLALAPLAGSSAMLIHADHLELPSDDGLELSTDAIADIGKVEYEVTHIVDEIYWWDNAGYQTGTKIPSMSLESVERAVPAAADVKAYRRRIYMHNGSETISTGQIFRYDYNTNQTVEQHLDATAAMIAKLNRRPSLPEVIFDWERSGAAVGQTIADALLYAGPYRLQDRPVIVTAAPALAEIGIENYGQIIGGTLTYRQGWRHQLKFAPTVNSAPSDLTYAQLVTNTTATYDSWSPDITYNDWSLITQGAS